MAADSAIERAWAVERDLRREIIKLRQENHEAEVNLARLRAKCGEVPGQPDHNTGCGYCRGDGCKNCGYPEAPALRRATDGD